MASFMTHTTNNCTVFGNAIQKALKEGRLELAKKGDMIVDTNSFGMSINMVSIFTAQKGYKGGKGPRREKNNKMSLIKQKRALLVL